MDRKRLSRRAFLRAGTLSVGGAVLASCAPQVVKETVEVEVEVEVTREVKEEVEVTVEVEKEPAPQEPVTLSMWKGPHKPAGEETRLCAQPTLDRFQAMNPNITVDFQEVPWGQVVEKWSAALAAGEGPDVSYLANFGIPFMEEGHFRALDDLMDATAFNKDFFYPREWGPCTVDGEIAAVPWFTGASMFYWNKDLFEQAGLDPDTPPDTVEDFLSYCEQISALGDDIYGYATTPTGIHENGQWLRRYGGYWFAPEDWRTVGIDECVANSQEALAGWQFLSDLHHEYEVAMPGAISGQEPGLVGYFRDGKVGMISGQPPTANTIRVEAPDFRLGAAIAPKGPAPEPRGRATYGSGGRLAMAVTTEYPEETWELLQFLVTAEALESWVACLGWLSPSPHVNLYPDDPILSTGQRAVGFGYNWPFTGWLFQFYDIANSAVESFILGQRSVEEAMEEMVVKINDVLAEQA